MKDKLHVLYQLFREQYHIYTYTCTIFSSHGNLRQRIIKLSNLFIKEQIQTLV